MATLIPINTSTEASGAALTIVHVMRLLQFGDSMLPVGAFSFSNGLESAVQQRIVSDVNSLREYVETAIDQAATSDGIALLVAHRGALVGDLSQIVEADCAALNRKLNEEMRTMSVRMGRKLAELSDRLLPESIVNAWLAEIQAGRAPGNYAIAQALVFAALGLSERDAFAVHQYGLATMMLGAAVRLMRLDYVDAQAILYEINTAADAAYQRVASSTLAEMAAFAPLSDILAATHVQAHIRMFMN